MTPRPARRPRLVPRLLALTAAVFLAAPPAVAWSAPTAPPSPTAPASTVSSTAPGTGDGTASAPGNATFGLQPVTNGRIDSRNAFTYQTGPGGQYADAFAVVNYAPSPVTLEVYTADLDNNADGGLTVGAAGAVEHGASNWLRLPSGLTSVDLPAAGATTGPALQQIPFAWAVPTSAAAGDHTAAIVASLSVRSTGSDGQPVTLDQRVALRVFFRVSGTIDARLSVTDFEVVYRGTWDPTSRGTAQVSYTLTNVGNVRLGATSALTSSAWFGRGGTPAPIEGQPLLLPGASVKVTSTIRDVFPGIRLTTRLHVTPVRAADDVGVEPASVDARTGVWAPPWAIVVAVLVLLLLIGGAVWRWRRRRRHRPASRHGRGRGGPAGDGRADDGADPDPTGPVPPVLSRGGVA